MEKKILVITDNEFVYNEMLEMKNYLETIGEFEYVYSYFNESFKLKFKENQNFKPMNIVSQVVALSIKFDLIISWHCKQIFPVDLLTRVKCINIHPGFNPYNRGWFPQVFSILNKKPCGVTIHEIDEKLDHGPIIVQENIAIRENDTSYSVYCKIMQCEKTLFQKNIKNIVDGAYKTFLPINEGNINLKKDFDSLLELNLNQEGKLGDFIDQLRALTFDSYENAYFRDKQGKKIYVSINLKCEK